MYFQHTLPRDGILTRVSESIHFPHAAGQLMAKWPWMDKDPVRRQLGVWLLVNKCTEKQRWIRAGGIMMVQCVLVTAILV